jgi:hypothetical protein
LSFCFRGAPWLKIWALIADVGYRLVVLPPTSAIGAVASADVGSLSHYRRCRLLLLFLMSPAICIVGIIADVDAPCTRLVLLSEFDIAGYTDALEIPLLLSSNVVTADIELDQRPHILDGISDSSRT